MTMNRRCCLFTAAFAIGVWISHSATAAEFRKSSLQQGGADLIEVTGDLSFGDEKKFIDAALTSSDAVVVFQSRGGNLFAGIEIGKAIRLKGFSTMVPDKMQCASACALAWLGGRTRFMSDTAQVGFHAVYTAKDGQTSVSSAGNAMAGAYLNQLGLPMSAVIYITDASPESIQWLSFADAKRYGIEVSPLNLAAVAGGAAPKRDTPPAADKTKQPQFSSVDHVRAASAAFVSATNRANDVSLSYLEDKYTAQVVYFGKTKSRSSILNEKRAFFQKWPDRNYSIEPDTLKVTCLSDVQCKSEGVVNWRVVGPKLKSVGSATFSLVWTQDGDAWRISSEESRVITRKVSAAPAVGQVDPPEFHLDASGNKVLSLSNLYSDRNCYADRSAGTVVQRKFGEDGVTVSGFVIETADGSRQFVNVDRSSFENADSVTKSWVIQGLNVLLTEGRSTVIDFKACGAAGRVLVLDVVR